MYLVFIYTCPSQNTRLKKNFIQHKLTADIREGNLFDPWSDKKFDYIINDVSGISSVIAKNSPWFGDEIPCDSGEDGSNLTVSIIKKAKISFKDTIMFVNQLDSKFVINLLHKIYYE